MSTPGLSFIKTFIKSSLDNYVLPGTLTGTEILIVYLSHWKRQLQLLTTCALTLLKDEPDPFELEDVSVCNREVISGGEGAPETDCITSGNVLS